jgi:hypothetical protein
MLNYRNRRSVSMLTIKQAHPSTLRRLFLGREYEREGEYKSQSARRFLCLSNYDIWLSLATWPRAQQNHAAGDQRAIGEFGPSPSVPGWGEGQVERPQALTRLDTVLPSLGTSASSFVTPKEPQR